MEEQKNTHRNNPKYKPVSCPRCKGRDVTFVPEYHRSIALRIIEIISFIILIIMSISIVGDFFSITLEADNHNVSMETMETMKTPMGTPALNTTSDNEIDEEKIFVLIILAISIGICKIIRSCIESQTHVQGVCKDCGNVWIHNSNSII